MGHSPFGEWVGSLTGERTPSVFFFFLTLSPPSLLGGCGGFSSSIVAPPLISAQQKKHAIRAIIVAAACFLAVQQQLRLLSGSVVRGLERGEEQGLQWWGESWNGHSSLQSVQKREENIAWEAGVFP